MNLKTLKDLENLENNIFFGGVRFAIKNGKETNEKIGGWHCDGTTPEKQLMLKEWENILFNDIRDEAIKWIKRYHETQEYCMTCGGCGVMKDFFNITEEELK